MSTRKKDEASPVEPPAATAALTQPGGDAPAVSGTTAAPTGPADPVTNKEPADEAPMLFPVFTAAQWEAAQKAIDEIRMCRSHNELALAAVGYGVNAKLANNQWQFLAACKGRVLEAMKKTVPGVRGLLAREARAVEEQLEQKRELTAFNANAGRMQADRLHEIQQAQEAAAAQAWEANWARYRR